MLNRYLLATALVCGPLAGLSQPAVTGEVSGRALEHTAASAKGAIAQARVALPGSVTGGAAYYGNWEDAPKQAAARAPVIVFLHGSSGLGLKAIEEWQKWLAQLGYASVAPDSFALPDRLTYKSPIDKATYERIHALRASEIDLAIAALQNAPWADGGRMVLAGTSEGAVAVARYPGTRFQGRLIYSWSCEKNYFVQEPGNAMPPAQPVLNVMSSTDVFFSPSNSWLGNPAALGHCATALKDNPRSEVVLIPGAPHTLINFLQARHATEGFLHDLIKP